jgi:hypothetical protein
MSKSRDVLSKIDEDISDNRFSLSAMGTLDIGIRSETSMDTYDFEEVYDVLRNKDLNKVFMKYISDLEKQGKEETKELGEAIYTLVQSMGLQYQTKIKQKLKELS